MGLWVGVFGSPGIAPTRNMGDMPGNTSTYLDKSRIFIHFQGSLDQKGRISQNIIPTPHTYPIQAGGQIVQRQPGLVIAGGPVAGG